MKAVWQETILAQSDQTISVEGNHYFPPTRSIKNTSTVVRLTAPALGKVQQAIIIFELVNRATPMPPGTILSRRTLPNRSKGTSPSGAG